jgi:zinc D-Ala-D-Ala carboxypeptidase
MKYFSDDEFKCKCCNVAHMDVLFLSQLNLAREFAAIPFVITSGYRCPKHNKEVGSTSHNHQDGKAVDIQCTDSQSRLKIVMGLIRAGFRRIGISKSFIHADSMNDVPCIWTY